MIQVRPVHLILKSLAFLISSPALYPPSVCVHNLHHKFVGLCWLVVSRLLFLLTIQCIKKKYCCVEGSVNCMKPNENSCSSGNAWLKCIGAPKEGMHVNAGRSVSRIGRSTWSLISACTVMYFLMVCRLSIWNTLYMNIHNAQFSAKLLVDFDEFCFIV